MASIVGFFKRFLKPHSYQKRVMAVWNTLSPRQKRYIMARATLSEWQRRQYEVNLELYLMLHQGASNSLQIIDARTREDLVKRNVQASEKELEAIWEKLSQEEKKGLQALGHHGGPVI